MHLYHFNSGNHSFSHLLMAVPPWLLLKANGVFCKFDLLMRFFIFHLVSVSVPFFVDIVCFCFAFLKELQKYVLMVIFFILASVLKTRNDNKRECRIAFHFIIWNDFKMSLNCWYSRSVIADTSEYKIADLKATRFPL